ncbi:hypothetical protein ACJ73_09958 [Blastomyces percursus]|uniref:Uncharacterized protein n=1 Tax=Blastomyces percursus TaxID=1658174 RepID=A0A1J9Q1C8_9EURO|nr:hypothetical protein ACJ73_09958 [Blastomyces percursus]
MMFFDRSLLAMGNVSTAPTTAPLPNIGRIETYPRIPPVVPLTNPHRSSS